MSKQFAQMEATIDLGETYVRITTDGWDDINLDEYSHTDEEDNVLRSVTANEDDMVLLTAWAEDVLANDTRPNEETT